MLHYFLEQCGLNTESVRINADNCSGHNKNNGLLQVIYTCNYTVLLTIIHYSTCHGEFFQRKTSFTISFLPAGHTKFSPHWCFGLVKRALKRAVVGAIHDIVDVINSSAVCNKGSTSWYSGRRGTGTNMDGILGSQD